MIDLRFSLFGWAVQLSITNVTLRPSNANFLFCSLTHSLNNPESIQLFFSAWYRHEVLLIPLKQRGLFDFPIANIRIFSPRMLAAAGPVSRILLFFYLHYIPRLSNAYFLWEVLYKINQTRLHCICHGSRNGKLWLAKLFPSTERSFYW